MSENTAIQCPFNGSCPQTIQNANEIEKLNERMELQNKYIIEKIDTIASDVREVKQSLGPDLDRRVDERITAKLNEQKAGILKWVIGAAISSGALGSILTTLFK